MHYTMDQSNHSANINAARQTSRVPARRRGARRLCSLLALAFIVFVPLPELGWRSGSPSGGQQEIGPNGIFNSGQTVEELAINHGGAGDLASRSSFGMVQPASAFYLDQVGQISRVLSEFVDVLLEKVSFLAEIIIESSLEEQCDYAALNASCQSARPGDAGNLGKLVAAKIKFDELEYTNVDLFKSTIMANEGSAGGSNCRLFSLSVNTQDLPVDGMDSCCESYATCYSTCNRPKLGCDLDFRQCLRSMCKDKFDFTNRTVVAAFLSSAARLRAERSGYEPLAEDTVAEEAEDEEEKEFAYADPHARRRRREDRPTMSEIESKRLRDKYKACKLATKVLVVGNLAFGCQVYKQSQALACCNASRPSGHSEV